jgi:ATP-dependent RNA helicase RhlE
MAPVLHPDLGLRGVKELGFTRPRRFRRRDSARDRGPRPARLRDDGQRQDRRVPAPDPAPPHGKPRGTRARSCSRPRASSRRRSTSTSSELAVHTPMSGAAVFGGVGMGPQEHAFRSGVDVIVATPGRLLDHFRQPYAKLDRLEVLVLDEADRMLDMGFLPTSAASSSTCRQAPDAVLLSATMPAPIAQLSKEMLKDPARSTSSASRCRPSASRRPSTRCRRT